MKALLSLIFIFAVAGAQAQEKTKLQSALDIFQKDSSPYLQELVEREYGPGNSPMEKMVKDSRLQILKAKISVINDDVTAALKENPITDMNMISKIISRYYRETYTGLSKEFYDKAEAEVQKL